MILTALAFAQPLAAGPVTLEPRQPGWATRQHFAGPASLALELRRPQLHPSSTLTVKVDGTPIARLVLDGTPVPEAVSLGTLTGVHEVSLHADLKDPWSEDCDPGSPWLTVDGDLEGVVDAPALPVEPSGIAAWLQGRTVRVEGGGPAMKIEAATWLAARGAVLGDDGVAIRLQASMQRQVTWEEEGLVVTGDPSLVRELAFGVSLERCAAWPCHWGPGELSLPARGDTLADQGLQAGITLRGRAQAIVVFEQDAPAQTSVLQLQVQLDERELLPSSTVTVELEGRPLATWTARRLQGSARQLSIEVPSWARSADRLAFVVRTDLHAVETACAPDADLPWLTIGGASGLAVEGEEAEGLAGDARRIRAEEVATVCAPDLSNHAAALLAGLRHRGGWVDDCEAPDVRVTAADPEGFTRDERGLWGLVAGDPVPVDPSRWTVRAGTPVRVHVPDWNTVVPPLAWTASPSEVVVSTPSGWSMVGSAGEPAGLSTGATPIVSDAEARRGRLNFLFACGFLLLAASGLAWIWRSGGTREGWMEEA